MSRAARAWIIAGVVFFTIVAAYAALNVIPASAPGAGHATSSLTRR